VALGRMLMAHMTTHAIGAAAKLGVADHLKDAVRSSQQLAEATGTQAPSLYRLLRALASVGLVEEDELAHFRLTPVGAYLRSDVPGSVRDFALMLNEPWHTRPWEGLVHSIETGEPAFDDAYGMGLWEYLSRHAEEGMLFDAAMSGGSYDRANALLQSCDLSGVSTLVDVGGGQGRLLAIVLAAHPSMRGILFDRPEVVAAAGQFLQEARISDRCNVVAGDVFDSVPSAGDAYVLSQIIHDWDDERAIKILQSCRLAMEKGSRILLLEQVILPGNGQSGAKFLDLDMLVLIAGRERTAAEFRSLFEATGFAFQRVVPTLNQWCVIEGRAA
jgi:hypothetical protein